MKISIFFKNFDWCLILPACFLTLFGLISIYSFSIGKGDFLYFKKQLLFFGLSLILLLLFNFLDLRFLKRNSYLLLSLYLVSILSIIGLFLLGSQIRGIKGWYKLGDFSFNPTPFVIICVIAILSKYFAVRHIETKRFQPILFSFIYVFIPAFLLFFQPDLGSVIILFSVWLGIIIFSGMQFRHFLILGLCALILFAFAWQFWLKDYQKQRILTFLNPKSDPQGTSWNINQSKIAIGSGGFWGKGIAKGSQTQYGFLPEVQTDFIFSSIAEETGFFGILVLISLFIFLFHRIIKIALSAQNNFARLFTIGFSCFLIAQTFINIGMSLGILPVIGIPLPFVSYGGSYILAFYLGLGILKRI